jgi:hypothetical protein
MHFCDDMGQQQAFGRDNNADKLRRHPELPTSFQDVRLPQTGNILHLLGAETDNQKIMCLFCGNTYVCLTQTKGIIALSCAAPRPVWCQVSRVVRRMAAWMSFQCFIDELHEPVTQAH